MAMASTSSAKTQLVEDEAADEYGPQLITKLEVGDRLLLKAQYLTQHIYISVFSKRFLNVQNYLPLVIAKR